MLPSYNLYTLFLYTYVTLRNGSGQPRNIFLPGGEGSILATGRIRHRFLYFLFFFFFFFLPFHIRIVPDELRPVVIPSLTW